MSGFCFSERQPTITQRKIYDRKKIKIVDTGSIDGYMADDGGKTDWMVWNWGPTWSWDLELQKWFTDLTASVGCILLSRKMAEEGFISHWKNVAERNNDPQQLMARKIVTTPKVVFSKTLGPSDLALNSWENTTLAGHDTEKDVKLLKAKKGADIIVYGGSTFASSLIDRGLIDEIILMVNPIALGSGMKLFRDKMPLRLERVHSFACGVNVLIYNA